ncbi:MAG TPA: hypothetical protein VF544_24585 [Pyrinomonadaceae bacterium]|jgi:hypothetical protein
MTTVTIAATPLPDAPYRGIEPFRYVDQPIFFARDEETQKLLRYVVIYRGVLFYGDSGSGKSSLINAGFIPAIIDEGLTPDRLRVQPRPGEEIIVERISIMADGQAPYLPSNFAQTGETAKRIVLSAEEFKRRIRELPANRRPLLIFDQFEEFSTLFEEAPRGEAIKQAQAAHEAILNTLVELLRDARLPVKLLFVFREDYLAKLSKLFALIPDLLDQYVRLTPPGIAALPLIIRGSFNKFPGQFGRELSAELTSDLAAAIETRMDSNKLNLSEVQIACLELWQSDDPDKLFREQGVQGLLESYLSDSLNRLPDDLRDPAVALLSRMVTPAGTRNVVSEYDLLTQVNEDENIPEDKLRAALQALVQDTRLVRRERRYDNYFYDIVSEFLVPWIAREKAERLAEIARRKLEAAERLKRRKAYRATAMSLLFALIVALGAWYIYAKRTVDVRAREDVIAAGREVKIAQHEKALAEQKEKEARDARGQAEEQARRAEQATQEALQAKTQVELDASKAKLQAEQEKAELTVRLRRAEEDNADLKRTNASLQDQLGRANAETEKQKGEKDKAEREALEWRGLYIDALKKLEALKKRGESKPTN